jgi:hypothetical protein
VLPVLEEQGLRVTELPAVKVLLVHIAPLTVVPVVVVLLQRFLVQAGAGNFLQDQLAQLPLRVKLVTQELLSWAPLLVTAAILTAGGLVEFGTVGDLVDLTETQQISLEVQFLAAAADQVVGPITPVFLFTAAMVVQETRQARHPVAAVAHHLQPTAMAATAAVAE